MKAKILKATLLDAEEIEGLIKSDPNRLLPRPLKEIEKYIENFYIVKDSGAIVACGSFEDYSPRIAEIRSLIVSPHYQGKGLGKLLVRALMKKAKKNQEVFVVTSNPEFFKNLGFQPALREREILFTRGK